MEQVQTVPQEAETVVVEVPLAVGPVELMKMEF